MEGQAAYIIVTQHDPTKDGAVQWEARLYEFGADYADGYLHYEGGRTEEQVVSDMQAHITALQLSPDTGHEYYTDDLGAMIAAPRKVA